MPRCQHVSMSSCQHFSMSACHHFSMSACQYANMPRCQHVSMSSCQPVSMSACLHVSSHHLSISACQHVNMATFQHISMSACQHVSMSACQHVSMSAWPSRTSSRRQKLFFWEPSSTKLVSWFVWRPWCRPQPSKSWWDVYVKTMKQKRSAKVPGYGFCRSLEGGPTSAWSCFNHDMVHVDHVMCWYALKHDVMKTLSIPTNSHQSLLQQNI